MKDLSKSVLNKIKGEKIKPKPKWFFSLKETIILSAFVLAVIFGGLFFGLILSKMMEFDYDFGDRVPPPRFIGLIFLVFPYLWFIFFGIFLFGAYYYLKHTKHGYKYSFTQVAVLNLIVTMCFGLLLFFSGFTDFLQDNMRSRMPFYHKMFFSRDHMWMMEERGFLGGEITKIIDENNFELRDFKNRLWIVSIPEAVFFDKPKIKVGAKVRMVGEKKENGFFEATDIRTWERGEGMRKRMTEINE